MPKPNGAKSEKPGENRSQARSRAKEKFIQSAVEHPGALREFFGVKDGETIPVSSLRAEQQRLRAKESRTAAESTRLKRINLALTLRGLSRD